ncbi:hypothetical protein [Bacillus pseudomycoides]|uniref:hypothetical protein n=1 Tax=Bacillus pseudomycoides TaxID=64104 RepID=UPI0020D271C5|nr:hypothetical protein [Bacillus pseudomycoides]
MRTTQRMLAITEVGDKWINENEAIIEHKREGIKWQLTDRFFSIGAEVWNMNWSRFNEGYNETRPGTFKRTLVESNYPWDMIKDWSEEDCEAEIGAIDGADVL